MLTQDQVREVIGTTAYDPDGDKIGKVGQVYFDDVSGEAEWVTVNTGFFGSSESFAPVRDAEFSGDRLTVRHDADTVKNAPNVGDDGHLEPEEERALYDHYGVSWGDDTTTTDAPVAAESAGHDTSGPNTDEAMTRSEERVAVGTTSQEAGKARLRKYVVTEQETHTVPVRKEKAVLETEPITDANRGQATDGAPISEEEHEVVLREERPVVEKTTEAVERVRIGTETTTEEQTVTEDVRKEKIEAEGDVDNRGTGTTR